MEKILKTALKQILIANPSLMTEQSCDCDEIIILTENNTLHITLDIRGENSVLNICPVSNYDFNSFLYTPDVEISDFTFDKLIYTESGDIDAIRYKGKNEDLYVFADEYNLILTLSKYDLFEETDMPYFEEEAKLNIKKLP